MVKIREVKGDGSTGDADAAAESGVLGVLSRMGVVSADSVPRLRQQGRRTWSLMNTGMNYMGRAAWVFAISFAVTVLPLRHVIESDLLNQEQLTEVPSLIPCCVKGYYCVCRDFHATQTPSMWGLESPNPSKAATENFFIVHSFVWITLLAIVVVTEAYKSWGDVEYLSFSLAIAAPCWLYPWLFPCAADRRLPVSQHYWLKANVWIALFSFVGNYFWTHYFYKVLGASYSFPVTWELNQVPVFLYIMTHPYFCTYHVLSNRLLRWARSGPAYSKTGWSMRLLRNCLVVGPTAYVLSFLEAWTLENMPFYEHHDRWAMYTLGSAFYSLYFVVSFPSFYRLDESGPSWSVGRAAQDSLAAAMLVFILCDFWRLLIGPLQLWTGTSSTGVSGSGVPFA